jgi:hypothetical protein
MTHATIRRRAVAFGNPAWMAQVVNDRGHSVTMMLPTHEAAIAEVPALVALLEGPARVVAVETKGWAL